MNKLIVLLLCCLPILSFGRMATSDSSPASDTILTPVRQTKKWTFNYYPVPLVLPQLVPIPGFFKVRVAPKFKMGIQYAVNDRIAYEVNVKYWKSSPLNYVPTSTYDEKEPNPPKSSWQRGYPHPTVISDGFAIEAKRYKQLTKRKSCFYSFEWLRSKKNDYALLYYYKYDFNDAQRQSFIDDRISFHYGIEDRIKSFKYFDLRYFYSLGVGVTMSKNFIHSYYKEPEYTPNKVIYYNGVDIPYSYIIYKIGIKSEIGLRINLNL